MTDDENLLKVAMFEKRESKKYLFEIPIVDKKFELPAGLIEGQNLENYFSELFWPLTSNENFDSLPIPFHCVSVDLVSGNPIEHKSGDLVKSIRASMSIPTIFTPVRMDSMLLVDGGVLRNFPVQEAIDMGADIIIGVYVGNQEEIQPDDVFTMTEILQRSLLLSGIVDAREQNANCEILIVPDLGKYGPGDFAKGKVIQQLGEEAARRQMNELVALAERLNLEPKTIPKIKQPKRILISDIEVEGLQFLSENDVVSRSGIDKGDSVTYNNIKESIEYMHGTRYFNKLTYSLKKNKDKNGYILVFLVKENPRVMFNITPSYDNEFGAAMVVNFTLRNVIMPSSRLLFSTNISENPRLELVFDRTIGNSQHWTDELFLNLNRYTITYFDFGTALGNYKRDFLELGYGVNYSLGLNSQLGAKAFFRNKTHIPQPDLYTIFPEAKFKKHTSHDWGYAIFYIVNTTDNLYFPKKGIKMELDVTHTALANSQLVTGGFAIQPNYFLDEIHQHYATLYYKHDWFITIAKRFTFNFGLDAGFNTNNPGINGMFVLGGEQLENTLMYKNLSGYRFAELYTYNYSFAKSALNIEVVNGLYLSGTVNVGNIGNTVGDLFDEFSNRRVPEYLWGYSVGLKYNSLLGPVQLLFTNNKTINKPAFHFSIGYPF